MDASVDRKDLSDSLAHGQVERSDPVKKLRLWHQQIVDFYLTHPKATQGDCARHFNMTQGWVSQIENSDAFREYRAARMQQHHQIVSLEIVDRVQEMTKTGLELMHERMKLNGLGMPFGNLKDATELGLKSLGFGGRGGEGPGVLVQVNNINKVQPTTVTPEMLQNAREKMQRVLAINTETVESVVIEHAEIGREPEGLMGPEVDLTSPDSMIDFVEQELLAYVPEPPEPLTESEDEVGGDSPDSEDKATA